MEFKVIRSLRDSIKEELFYTVVPLDEVDEAVGIFIKGLTNRFGLDFEVQDFTEAQTLDEFHTLAERYGWKLKRPS